MHHLSENILSILRFIENSEAYKSIHDVYTELKMKYKELKLNCINLKNCNENFNAQEQKWMNEIEKNKTVLNEIQEKYLILNVKNEVIILHLSLQIWVDMPNSNKIDQGISFL